MNQKKPNQKKKNIHQSISTELEKISMDLDKTKYKPLKNLNITDKEGIWIQVEMLDGPDKGMRRPLCIPKPDA